MRMNNQRETNTTTALLERLTIRSIDLWMLWCDAKKSKREKYFDLPQSDTLFGDITRGILALYNRVFASLLLEGVYEKAVRNSIFLEWETVDSTSSSAFFFATSEIRQGVIYQRLRLLKSSWASRKTIEDSMLPCLTRRSKISSALRSLVLRRVFQERLQVYKQKGTRSPKGKQLRRLRYINSISLVSSLSMLKVSLFGRPWFRVARRQGHGGLAERATRNQKVCIWKVEWRKTNNNTVLAWSSDISQWDICHNSVRATTEVVERVVGSSGFSDFLTQAVE